MLLLSLLLLLLLLVVAVADAVVVAAVVVVVASVTILGRKKHLALVALHSRPDIFKTKLSLQDVE